MTGPDEVAAGVVVAVALGASDQVGPGWGRAPRVALARVQDGTLASWVVEEVHWDDLHETGSEAAHHARIARFVKQNGVGIVVAGHMGPGMQAMMARMGIQVHLGAEGDARQVVLAAAAPAQGTGVAS